ncbi:nuclear factor 7, brain-like [Amphiprion ocellaris]|uniref:Zinc-binding protein A33-like n=1 Tax=Amphiprion ocellaris TaxID=80972 RepID=A0AAQ6A871_AMPOC|nr:nuclear factor 7, brain-like [Amphiprion ocellaris]
MSCMWSVPQEDLSCPVCRGIFKDPVLLPCSHSICKCCVFSWWRAKGARECPCCRTVSSSNSPPRNLVLKNFCDAFLLEVQCGLVCRLHYEKFKLYCLDDQIPVCVVCRDSKQHRGHTFIPADEAAETYRADLGEFLNPLKEKLKVFNKAKGNWEKTDEDIKNQTLETEMKIREEFRLLQEFLHTEEEMRIAALKDEEECKRKMMKDKIAGLTGEINALESTIKTIESGLREEGASFLLKADALKKEAQRPLPELKEVTGALINVAKHLGNMSFNVWHKMKHLVSYSPVILNPNTAHEELHLSDSLTSVRCGLTVPRPAAPERMEMHRSVLGSQGFISGIHEWTVEVADNPVWALGVIAQDAKKRENITSGLWMLRFGNGTFTAFSPSRPASVIPLKGRPRRVRVQLDFRQGKLSFSDPDTDTVIHTFTHKFTNKLFPYINTWKDRPLKISTLQPSVTLEKCW